jgi:HAD superfamily phosphoserine phosphatase-like hydrolase
VALALFDLDNTLLAGDSEHAWGEFLIEIGAVDEEEFRAENDRLYEEYLAGTLDIYESIRFQLGPLMEHPPDTLRRWQEEFMRLRIEPMITQAAVALVEEHRGSGDELAIITASNSFVTRPIADRFGVRELLAVELERKVLRLQEWIESNCRTLEGSHFYSDSHNDLPLLQLVDHPVAVDPDPVLRAHAEEVGWPILSLHDAT